MISLSKKAADRIKELTTPEQSYLRVYATGGGCSGINFKLALDETCTKDDHLFEIEGIKTVIDKRSILYLDNATIDYLEEKQSFSFNNNINKTCSCHQANS